VDFQPEGLSDSSRWSQRSADHRKGVPPWSVPRRGTTVFLTPVPGVELFSIVVRWSALRCDHRLLSDSLSGWGHLTPGSVLYRSPASHLANWATTKLCRRSTPTLAGVCCAETIDRATGNRQNCQVYLRNIRRQGAAVDNGCSSKRCPVAR
jgi:hypothetical protein